MRWAAVGDIWAGCWRHAAQRHPRFTSATTAGRSTVRSVPGRGHAGQSPPRGATPAATSTRSRRDGRHGTSRDRRPRRRPSRRGVPNCTRGWRSCSTTSVDAAWGSTDPILPTRTPCSNVAWWRSALPSSANGTLYEADGVVAALHRLRRRQGPRRPQSDGLAACIAGDIAYLRTKFDRGSTTSIYMLGADHHGYVVRLKAAAAAASATTASVEVR